ncbi:MAG: anaerobic glycerol-3-phosphate dehydrogenase subunit C [Bacillota bacterium]
MSTAMDRNLDYCLKCNICSTQCPVSNNKLDFPGPKHLGPELERLRLAWREQEPIEIEASLGYCTNCKRCDIVCPHGVRPSYYNVKNKAIVKDTFSHKFRDWILAHNVWWGKLAGKMPTLANMGLSLPLAKSLFSLLGMAKRDFPQYSKQRFKLSKQKKVKKVLYFPGCYASFNEPEIIQAAIEILEAYHYQVELAPEICCGTPMLSNGLLNESMKLARKNMNCFLRYIDKGFRIITTCPSCGLAFKEEYKDILPGETSSILAQNVWDLFELLIEEEMIPFDLTKNKLDNVYYHVPCHLKAQVIGIPAAAILKNVAVTDLILEDSFCCGLAGTYGFKKEKYDLSLSIGTPLLKDIAEKNPLLVITDCGTCKVQISHKTNLNVYHPVLILRNYLESTAISNSQFSLLHA